MRARDAHGVVRRGGVEIGAGRKPPFRQLIFPPAARAHDPVTGLRLLRPRRDGRLDVLDRADVGEVDLGLQVLARGEMDVRVVEARKHGLAVKVDDAGVRPLGLQHLCVAAYGDEAAVADRGGLRGREARVDGDDMRVADDEVGRRAGGHSGRGA